MKKFITAVVITLLLSCMLTYANGSGATSGGNTEVQGSAGDTNNTKVLREKYPITLECQIIKKKDEKVQLKWFKDEMEIIPDDDHYKINQENGTLFIAAASKEDVGLYKCQTVNYSPAQSFNISIIFLTYKKMPKSVTVLKGERLTLACDVEGDPVPIVTWLKDNENVDEVVNASHFSLEESEGKVPNATLIIPTVEYEDRAQYLCKIASAGVRFNSTTLVRVKDMYAALWPFLGICAEVIILCLIIFVYEKRRLKADFEESDTDQPVEQKNKSDNNKDVRQRK